MRSSFRFFALSAMFLTIVASAPLHADVFSLWPFSGNQAQGGNGSGNLASILEPKAFWNEKLSINGTQLELNIGLVDLSMRDAVNLLRAQFPKARFAANESSVLFEQPLNKKMRRRIYLLKLHGVNQLLQFSMDVPEKMPEAPLSLWPSELPLPPGAKELQVMQFPKRNATFGAFTSIYTKEQVLADMTALLRAAKWTPMSKESENVFQGTGNLFMKQSPMSILLLGTLPIEKNETRVNLYLRPVR